MDFYTFARGTVDVLLKPIYRFDVIGKENIPSKGSALVCSNHINNLDPLTVGVTYPRPIHFMAKEELFSNAMFASILKNVNAFPVKRGMSDREALRKGIAVLKDENVLGLFPEGTRSKDGKLGKGLAGAGFFALRTKADVIPCAIIGPYKLFGKIKVVYGAPIDMETLRTEKASAEHVTNVIMESIQSLIDKYN